MSGAPEKIDHPGPFLLRGLDGQHRVFIQSENRLVEQRYVGAASFSHANRVARTEDVIQLHRVPLGGTLGLSIDGPLH